MPDEDYVEYDASAGSVTTAVDKDNNTAGSGYAVHTDADHVRMRTSSLNPTTSPVKVPQYATRYYYKSWWHKLFRKKIFLSGFCRLCRCYYIANNTLHHPTPGTTRLSTVNLFDGSQPVKTDVNSSYTLCLANTDDDTSYMTYTGKHYYTYSDPQVSGGTGFASVLLRSARP